MTNLWGKYAKRLNLKLSAMNKRHRKTLDLIFTQPISGNIKWHDVNSLFESLGAIFNERSGSRVAILLNDRVAVFHRPHPNPNLDKGMVRDIRRFLESTGIMP